MKTKTKQFDKNFGFVTKKNYRKYYEFYHNKSIPQGFVIHHIDGNRDNNKINNLICISSKEHKDYHNKLERLKYIYNFLRNEIKLKGNYIYSDDYLDPFYQGWDKSYFSAKDKVVKIHEKWGVNVKNKVFEITMLDNTNKGGNYELHI